MGAMLGVEIQSGDKFRKYKPAGLGAVLESLRANVQECSERENILQAGEQLAAGANRDVLAMLAKHWGVPQKLNSPKKERIGLAARSRSDHTGGSSAAFRRTGPAGSVGNPGS